MSECSGLGWGGVPRVRAMCGLFGWEARPWLWFVWRCVLWRVGRGRASVWRARAVGRGRASGAAPWRLRLSVEWWGWRSLAIGFACRMAPSMAKFFSRLHLHHFKVTFSFVLARKALKSQSVKSQGTKEKACPCAVCIPQRTRG